MFVLVLPAASPNWQLLTTGIRTTSKLAPLLTVSCEDRGQHHQNHQYDCLGTEVYEVAGMLPHSFGGLRPKGSGLPAVEDARGVVFLAVQHVCHSCYCVFHSLLARHPSFLVFKMRCDQSGARDQLEYAQQKRGAKSTHMTWTHWRYHTTQHISVR